MKVAVVSDLHLEHRTFEEYMFLSDTINKKDWDILCIAGDLDTHGGTLGGFFLDFFREEKRPFLKIDGNHDLYKGAWTDRIQPVQSSLGFVCATFWTNFWGNYDYASYIPAYISDFSQIWGVSPEEMIRVNKEEGDYIRKSPMEFVMTHYPPALNSLDPKFKDKSYPWVNSYFINDQPDLLEGKKLWICGHTHWAHSYWLNGCYTVCNPLGYPNEIYKSVRDYPILIIDTEKL